MLHFSFRNIFRNKRRSAITLISVIVATFLVISMRFLVYGSHQEALRNAVSLTSGFIQIAAFGWLENKPLERALDIDEKLIRSLKIEGVDIISPRIEGFALASFKSQSSFISIRAIDPIAEKRITTLHTYPVEGEFLHEIDTKPLKKDEGVSVHKVILGRTLANDLNVQLKDEISLVATQFGGSVGAILAQVVGIYKTLDPFMDGNTIYLPIESGEDLFDLGELKENIGTKRYTSLLLGIEDHLKAGEVYEELSSLYPKPELPPGENAEDSDIYSAIVHFWPDLIPGLVELLEFDKATNEASFFFLVLLMAFGILNTVQMSIQERLREFGILIALGTKRNQLLKMIFMEVIFILTPGLIIGSIMGIALGSYFYYYPYQFSGEIAEASSSMGMPVMHMKTIVNFDELWTGILTLFLPSMLFTYLAGRRIYKIDPVKVIASY